MKDPWITEYRDLLSLLPFVRWDRYTDSSVFGWIDRADGRADFVALINEPGKGVYTVTSSADRSSEIGRLIYDWYGAEWHPNQHSPCRRVEDALPELVNVVKLARGRGVSTGADAQRGQ